MKLLLDEMLPPTIAKRLRDEHGHDVVAVAERDELRGLQDADILLIAQEEERTIVTENVRDFSADRPRVAGNGQGAFRACADHESEVSACSLSNSGTVGKSPERPYWCRDRPPAGVKPGDLVVTFTRWCHL